MGGQPYATTSDVVAVGGDAAIGVPAEEDTVDARAHRGVAGVDSFRRRAGFDRLSR
jgi:hypothetical protein